MNLPKASIVVATFNNSGTLERALNGILAVSYPSDFEVIVVNDGSTDGTKEMLEERFSGKKNVKVFNLPRGGVCVARNTGIKASSFPFVVVMDHDCIPEKGWLEDLMKEFRDGRVGIVSSFDAAGGGTSTAYRKSALEKTGLFDERFYYYREDTDLVFRIIEAGFTAKEVKAEFFHDHKAVKPKGIAALLRHFWQRASYHKNDVLLYKNHPVLAGKFLDVRLGFIVNPAKDFRSATGTWASGVSYSLSSPRGITFIENKSPLHAAAIFLGGTAWVLALKISRLYGSIKFKKLLV